MKQPINKQREHNTKKDSMAMEMTYSSSMIRIHLNENQYASAKKKKVMLVNFQNETTNEINKMITIALHPSIILRHT
jgi:hypothetical protein